MFIGAEGAATIAALQSGKAAHARHPTQARGRARDAVEFAEEAKISTDKHESKATFAAIARSR
jgi:hypothetical protein